MATISTSSSSSSSDDADSASLLKNSRSYSFFPWNSLGESIPTDAERLPRLSKIDSRPPNWSLYKKDLNILCFSFLLVFMAFTATQNLESSINNKDKGLGSLSLGILYTSFTIFSLGAPAVVKKLGSKNSMLCALSGYWLFVAANLFPSWYSLVPASIFLGFCASILWVGQGSYLAYVAKGHSTFCGLPEEEVVGSFSGQFWSLFASSQVLGNLLVLSICLLLERGSSHPENMSLSTQRILFGTLLLGLSFGTILAFFMRNQPRNSVELFTGELDPDEEETMRGKEGGGRGRGGGGGVGGGRGALELAKGAFVLLGERNMVLLVPLLVYSGFQQAFVWNDFTESLITPSLGVRWVGGVMAFYGLSDAMASSVAGNLSSGVDSISGILGVGFCSQALVLLLLLLGFKSGPDWWEEGGVLFFSAGMWGVGDGILNSQLSSLLSIEFSNQTEGAFAQWRMWQSFGTALTFFLGPYWGFQKKLCTLLVTLVTAAVLFVKIKPKSRENETA